MTAVNLAESALREYMVERTVDGDAREISRWVYNILDLAMLTAKNGEFSEMTDVHVFYAGEIYLYNWGWYKLELYNKKELILDKIFKNAIEAFGFVKKVTNKLNECRIYRKYEVSDMNGDTASCMWKIEVAVQI